MSIDVRQTASYMQVQIDRLQRAWRSTHNNVQLLKPAEILLGTAAQHLHESDAEFKCVHKRIRAGNALSIGTLGGSNTAGASTTSKGEAPWLWHGLLVQALKYDTGNHSSRSRAANGGIPQTGPSYHALCGTRRLPPTPDLVMIDVAVNMADVTPVEQQDRSLEQLLRQLRRHPARPAILAANIHRWKSQINSNVSEHERSAAEAIVSRLCRHYLVPQVSLRDALSASVSSKERRWGEFMAPDGKHLISQGHAFLAQLIWHLLAPAPTGTRDTSQLSGLECPLPFRTLPPLLLTTGEDASPECTICADGPKAMRVHVASAVGFRAESDWKRDVRGFTARSAGASLVLQLCCPLSYRSAIFLTYYRGPLMGDLRLRCAGGCVCKEQSPELRISRGSPLPHTLGLLVRKRLGGSTPTARRCCLIFLNVSSPYKMNSQRSLDSRGRAPPLFKLVNIALVASSPEAGTDALRDSAIPWRISWLLPPEVVAPGSVWG